MNIIERVPEIELNNKCHYLSHRPEIKLNIQTTKVRPVFDASASQRGKFSLNKCLHKGINLLEMIPDILDRFRMFQIGISAVIEKAFLMLSVAPKDRTRKVRKDKKFIGIAELCLGFVLVHIY
ncbi:integrase catalytic domain-containing protein [Trichonephila clavipes]|nr:integrase catalytic domain-containing protein [Trichonephila clavipes]